MDEFDRIATIFRPLTQHAPEALELRDDAAWLQPPAGHTLIATADALVAGVHFLGTEAPALIAQKALRVNLSDLAAMGAAPYGFLLTTQLPADLPVAWLEGFAQGLRADMAEFGVKLFGGDSTRTTGPLTLSVTMLGLLPAGVAPLRRNGARVGDAVLVTGSLGAAALGLHALRGGIDAPALVARYHLPQPRLNAVYVLRGRASAALDISDGLLQDAGHIARESGVKLVIDASALPLADTPPEYTMQQRYDAALAGGDDYELLVTTPIAHVAEITKQLQSVGISCAQVGVVEAGQGVTCLHLPDGVVMPQATGWQHF
jgi:thiamine-monophosphate kinase